MSAQAPAFAYEDEDGRWHLASEPGLAEPPALDDEDQPLETIVEPDFDAEEPPVEPVPQDEVEDVTSDRRRCFVCESSGTVYPEGTMVSYAGQWWCQACLADYTEGSTNGRVALDDFNTIPALEAAIQDGPVFTDLRDITARDIEWLDNPFLPAGELVTNIADGDTGKGLFSVHVAARMTRGELGDRRMVIFAVAEDAFETVLKPRLLAANVDFDHIRALSWRRKGFKDAVRIPDDIPQLEQSIQALNAGMLVVDPLLSHLSGKTNSHVDHEVRIALQPLVDLAQRTKCLVLGNHNLGKDTSRGARKSAQSSNAFVNVPRVALAMAYDDEDADVRVVEIIKSNIGPKGIGRNYRIVTVTVAGLTEPQPVMVAEGAATKSVDELLAITQKEKRVPAELLRAIVLRELATGEKLRDHLNDVVKNETGANADSVYKSALKPLHDGGRIKPRKDGMTGPWYWRLGDDE